MRESKSVGSQAKVSRSDSKLGNMRWEEAIISFVLEASRDVYFAS